MSTRAEARDALFVCFRTSWVADTPAIVGSVPEVFYQGVDEPDDEPEITHVRAMVVHSNAPQRSMGEPGNRRFLRLGQFIAQVRAPAGVGMVTVDALAAVVVDAFEGKCIGDDIVIREVVANEVGTAGALVGIDVIANFEYDRIK